VPIAVSLGFPIHLQIYDDTHEAPWLKLKEAKMEQLFGIQE
jgi:hypothetical protein